MEKIIRKMRDWRNNEYPEEILRDAIGKPIPCESKGCLKPSVRNCCVAEGEFGRTHWHGAIHTKDGLKNLCRKCAEKENKNWKE